MHIEYSILPYILNSLLIFRLRLHNNYYDSTEETLKTETNDFVEGLMYSRDKAVIMSAKFTDQCDLKQVGKS